MVYPPLPRLEALKLGGKPSKPDSRTIRLAKLLLPARLPLLPETYNVDSSLPPIPDYPDGNDKYGDCVIAALSLIHI